MHLILVPADADGLARAVGETHRRYTRRINFREKWRGYLWQGRFSSYVMDEGYLLAAARYIERNPVKVALVERAEDWPWSSARAHVGRRGKHLAECEWLRELTAGWVCGWREFLGQADADADDATTAAAMRKAEATGRPLGDSAFVRRLETLLHRRLRPHKPGPKPTKRNRKRRQKSNGVLLSPESEGASTAG